MSWDVAVFGASEPPARMEDLPKDWKPTSLGMAEEVRRRISHWLLSTDWSDPTWGRYRGDGFTFEFNMGDEDVCKSFMIHTTGGGDPTGALLQMSQQPGWYFVDCSSGEWLHHSEEMKASWQGFQAYRDRVIDKQG